MVRLFSHTFIEPWFVLFYVSADFWNGLLDLIASALLAYSGYFIGWIASSL